MSRRTSRDERRRALGQNFLVDERAIARIVGTLHPPPGATVVDLGAGAGALTKAVAARDAQVIAVERDPHWAATLRLSGVRVIEGDMLRVPFPPPPYYVVSSAPYNIGTKLVRRLLTEGHGLARATVVLQLEAARRLAGRPHAGLFAASWAPWFELRVCGEIPPQAFRPVPRARSAIVSLEPRARPLLAPAAYWDYVAFLERLFRGGRAPARHTPEDFVELYLRRGAPRRSAGG